MKAVKVIEGNVAAVREVPVPRLRDGYLLCKVRCVALNPADWKYLVSIGTAGVTLGLDFSGTVIEIGRGCTMVWNKGDRVAGFVHGGNVSQPEDGAFGEYCLVKADVALKIPDSMSDDTATTLGVAVTTCGQALYQALELPLPRSDPTQKFLLVYGGSTSTGTLAIQYARLSGYRVITTASTHNFDLLKQRGAEAVFDYKDVKCAEKIREYTGDELVLALDCFADGDSATICEEAISQSKGGRICYLFRARHRRTDIEDRRVFAYTVFGESFEKFGHSWPAKPEDFERGQRFAALTSELLSSGSLATHPKLVGDGGLAGVIEGLRKLQEGKVSGAKLVYRVAEP